MEVRIGITHSPREIAFETDAQATEVRSLVETAVANNTPFVTLSDTKGRQYLINTSAISYVEIGGDSGRKVGFVN